MKNIPIHYIDKATGVVLFHTGATLHCIEINESYKSAVIYDNVAGYLSKENIVLILFSNGKIGLVCKKILYKLDSEDKLNPIDSTDILNGVNPHTITSICIQFNKIYILVDESLYYFTSDKQNSLYNKIKGLHPMQRIEFKNNIFFFLHADNSLFVENEGSYTNYTNISKFLIVANYVVFFYLDFTSSAVKYNTKKFAYNSFLSKTNNLLSFLSNPTNYDILDNILTVLLYEKDKDTEYLIYITKDNSVEILDVKRAKLVSVSTFLSIESTLTKLPLIDYSAGTYI